MARSKKITLGTALVTMIALIGYLLSQGRSGQAAPSPFPTAIPTPAITAMVTSRPEGQTYFVTRVIDGDTIELESGQKVRYIGINTPETTRGDCFAEEAKEANRQLVEGKLVRLEKDVSETDKYGRWLRYVSVDNTDVNDNLVRMGFAMAASYPPDIHRQEHLNAAQEEARSQLRGLWRSCENGVRATPLPSPTGACILKGNISQSGQRLLHLPGCRDYNRVTIDEEAGERWFCTEPEATAAGWVKAGNCPSGGV